ncbi:serine protease [Bowmanella sp. JS7-9]|uniref:Serine protease n=1 Tax=Pseudobowmanella zhangzhouensis TaxID=1537679 RepID=A0ABW1XQG4_9ALTE|nr:serine protease [Bowmanella sp. JS7-9]TBX23666.1 hypothetical protein TK45_06025 [Bowmanella sp. JS7-9]
MYRRLIPLLTLLSPLLQAQVPEHILRQVSPSIVKIETTSSAASGFIWQDKHHVVTALHVIDGKGPITVSYVNEHGQISASSAATVIKVFKEADLVLLQLSNPQPRTPLTVQTSLPAIKQQLDAVGFPMNIAGQSSTEVKVRFGGNQLVSIVPPKVLAKIVDYPSVTEPIVNLEGNLVPGLSGGPIVDHNGHVVGVVNGGLEHGAVGICWGIPSKQLDKLAASTISKTPGGNGINELFSADLDVSIDTVKVAGQTLIKLRSRSFAELAETADDQLGLAQLADVFQAFNPAGFMFDIYQDDASGGIIVVPSGATMTQVEGYTAATLEDGRNLMVYKVFRGNGIMDLNDKSNQFENELLELDDTSTAQLDPNWSYLEPYQFGDVLINRKAFFRHVHDGFQWQSERYYFETLAANDDTLLAVAAVDMTKTPDVLAAEMLCSQGYVDPYCQTLITQNRNWAHLVLAVLFATIPPSQF